MASTPALSMVALGRTILWGMLASVVLLALSNCSSAAADPCAQQPPECREAVEIALERLGPDGRAKVTSTHVEPETDCQLIDPAREHACPGNVTYAACVTFDLQAGERFPFVQVVVAEFKSEGMRSTWDSRRPGILERHPDSCGGSIT
jgi:hypothetical protein